MRFCTAVRRKLPLAYSVLDLKADCRGYKYVQETIKMLPEKPVVLENSNVAQLASTLYLSVHSLPQEDCYDTDDASAVNGSIVPVKATSRIGRGPGRTSTSNGCAVQRATGSFRNGRAR